MPSVEAYRAANRIFLLFELDNRFTLSKLDLCAQIIDEELYTKQIECAKKLTDVAEYLHEALAEWNRIIPD